MEPTAPIRTGVFCGTCGADWGACEHSRSVYQPQTAGLQGWECPRCHTVHGPFVQSCGCRPLVDVTYDNVTLDVTYPENGGGTDLRWKVT